MIDPTSARLFDRFRDRSLPKSEWTHDAHLVVCWVSLDELDESDALNFLRDSIRRYNEATGVANTATDGYHETLTRYYVHAVSALGDTVIDDVLGAESCTRDAPLRHWSRPLLFSPAARAEWVEPDLAPLPARSPGAQSGPVRPPSATP